MKKAKIFMFLCVFIIIMQQIFLLTQNEKNQIIQKDYSYKIFYGEWELTEFMGIGQHFRGDHKKEYIGTKIYYDSKKIEINSEVVVDMPSYSCAIIPMDKWYMFKSAMRPATGVEEMLGQDKPYFVHTVVENLYTKDNKYFEFGSEFYIVNEDEMILETEDGWYKMERLSYLDGYPDIIDSL